MNVKLSKGAKLPEFAHPGADVGADLRSNANAVVPAKGFAVIPTGVHIEVPLNMECKLESRSGLMTKGIFTMGGEIDPGYTGEVKVILANMSDEPYHVKAGDKITQMVFRPVVHPVFVKVSELKKTKRGDNGFGSTGK